MKIIVFGGDGYCGWPLSLALSDAGHEVTIVDNLSSRIGKEKYSITERLTLWKSKSRKIIDFKKLDIALNYQGLKDIIKKIQPDCVYILTDRISVNQEENKLSPSDFKNNIFSCFSIMSSLLDNELIDCHVYYFIEPLPKWDLTKEINYYLLRLFPKKINLFKNIHFFSFGNIWGKDTSLTASDKILSNRFSNRHINRLINLFYLYKEKEDHLIDHNNNYPFTHIQDFVNRTIKELGKENKNLNIENLYTETKNYTELSKIFSKKSKGFYRDEKDIYISPESIHEIVELFDDKEDL